MARSISVIQNQILANIAADSILGPLLTSPSSVALFNLFSYIVATSEATEEQLYDAFVTQIEAQIAQAAPMTPQWIQHQVLTWQYSSTTPQIIQLNTETFAPYWPVVNPSLYLVTRCAVIPGVFGQVLIKVAKGSTPTQLVSGELNALQSFVNTIGAAGIIYNAVSYAADLLSTAVTVYYQGSYASVIQANLLAAYNAYLASIPFNGTVTVSGIETALLGVTGVNDVVLNDISARPATTAFGSGVPLVTNNQWVLRQWPTMAGYIQDEVTTGQDFISLLTLQSQ